MAFPLASLVVLSALPVQVECASTCPSGNEVTQALAGLLHSVPEAANADVALVERIGLQLRIELRDAKGAVVAEKSLVREGSCAELATLAAVVIASWESDVHPEFARLQPELQPRPRTAIPMLAAPRRAAAFDLALGGSLAWAGGAGAGAMAALTWIPRATGPGLRLSLAGETEREVVLVQGAAHWRRLWSAAVFAWRLRARATAFDVHAGGLGGLLLVGGSGFVDNRTSTVFSPGVTAGIRVSWWVSSRFAPWLELCGMWWLRQHTVYGEPDLSQRDIPAIQILAAVGIAVGRSGQP